MVAGYRLVYTDSWVGDLKEIGTGDQLAHASQRLTDGGMGPDQACPIRASQTTLCAVHDVCRHAVQNRYVIATGPEPFGAVAYDHWRRGAGICRWAYLPRFGVLALCRAPT